MLQPIYSGKLLIINPDRFFAELSGRALNLLVPFSIVLIGAVILTIANRICYHSIAVPQLVVARLITLFVGWFLCAGAFYALSIFLGGLARSNGFLSLPDTVTSCKSLPRSLMP